MAVYVFPCDQWACGEYRLAMPARAIAGEDVRLIPGPHDVLRARVDSWRRVVAVELPDDAEVVVVQRPTHRIAAECVPVMRRQGVAVVVDMDDDLANVHPANPCFRLSHPAWGDPDNSWQNAAKACRDATLVTVSTPALARRYGAHGRVAVLPNCVSGRLAELPRVDSEVITWCGSLHAHPNDPQVMGSAIAEMVREGHTFAVVGDPTGDDGARLERILGLELEAPSTGPLPFDRWHEAVACSGVTVAPLADTVFNAGKSHLKAAEAMACGVPVVMSPRDDYRRLHERTGVGFLAERPRQWAAALRRLVNDAQLRREQSEAGRAAIAEHFMIERQAWRWAEAWDYARQLERQAVAA